MQTSNPAADRLPTAGRLWPYTVLPAVLLNLGGALVFALYYALGSVHPGVVTGISATEMSLFLYAMVVVVVEWSLAIAVMAGLHRSRISGASHCQLFECGGAGGHSPAGPWTTIRRGGQRLTNPATGGRIVR